MDINYYNKITAELLHDKPEALAFVNAYSIYIEMVDDYIDNDTEIKPTIQQVIDCNTSLRSSNYWRTNADRLFLVDQLISLFYGVSNKWLVDNADWKKQDGRCLSHCGYFMRLAIIILECGIETAKSFAPSFMENLHLRQLNT